MQRFFRIVALCALLFIAGCDEPSPTAGASDSPSATDGAPAGGQVTQQGGYATGRVTMADGSPLRGEIKDVAISIYGVSDAAERVAYSPAVKPDGTYRQKLAGGQYAFNRSALTLLYNGNEYQRPLEPVGHLWNKDRDAAEGIAQDWVWKVTGPTPYGQSSGLDPGNATHWYGMSIQVRADGYRNDIGAAPPQLPAGTRLTFTLKPTGKAIDGSDPPPLTIERTAELTLDLHDLLPAPYELTGTATLPDGTIKPLLLQGAGDYPNYKPMVQITVAKDNIIGGMWKPPVAFVTE